MYENIKDYEVGVEKVQEIVESLRSGDLPLHESMKRYEQGMDILSKLQALLDEQELKVKRLEISQKE